MTLQPAGPRHASIAATLQGIVGRVLRIEPRDLDIEAPFLELGADSLALVEALRGIQETFGAKLTIRQLFEQLPTISVLASHLEQTVPAAPAPAPAPGARGAPADRAPPPRPVPSPALRALASHLEQTVPAAPAPAPALVAQSAPVTQAAPVVRPHAPAPTAPPAPPHPPSAGGGGG